MAVVSRRLALRNPEAAVTMNGFGHFRPGTVPTDMSAFEHALATGFALDRRFHLLRGEMDTTKEPALLLLAQVLNRRGVRWAIIGGVAAQVRLAEARTTLDIDVALADATALPLQALQAAGFRHQGTFAHSDNWIGPGEVPVQFAADPAWLGAIDRATTIALENESLPIITAADLLRAKLVAGRDPARRRSKRLRDIADAVALVEQEPRLADELTEEERSWLVELR